MPNAHRWCTDTPIASARYAYAISSSTARYARNDCPPPPYRSSYGMPVSPISPSSENSSRGNSFFSSYEAADGPARSCAHRRTSCTSSRSSPESPKSRSTDDRLPLEHDPHDVPMRRESRLPLDDPRHHDELAVSFLHIGGRLREGADQGEDRLPKGSVRPFPPDVDGAQPHQELAGTADLSRDDAERCPALDRTFDVGKEMSLRVLRHPAAPAHGFEEVVGALRDVVGVPDSASAFVAGPPFRHTRKRSSRPALICSSVLEAVHARIANPLVADPLVDAIRGRVRQVRVEEAERPALVEEAPAERRDERARVPAAPILGRRVHGTDPDAVRRQASVPGQGDRPPVFPQHESAPGALQPFVDDPPRIAGPPRIGFAHERRDPLHQEDAVLRRGISRRTPRLVERTDLRELVDALLHRHSP